MKKINFIKNIHGLGHHLRYISFSIVYTLNLTCTCCIRISCFQRFRDIRYSPNFSHYISILLIPHLTYDIFCIILLILNCKYTSHTFGFSDKSDAVLLKLTSIYGIRGQNACELISFLSSKRPSYLNLFKSPFPHPN